MLLFAEICNTTSMTVALVCNGMTLVGTISRSSLLSSGGISDSMICLSSGGGWAASSRNTRQWVRVTAGRLYTLTTVETQGRGGGSIEWVTYYKLQYGINELDVNTRYVMDDTVSGPGGQYGQPRIFVANIDANTMVVHNLPEGLVASVITLRPTAWVGRIALRFEVRGCINNG